MSKRGKKHHHEEHVDESWLIPYADLLTLLLALFIVLFSMSSLDAKKFQAMSEVFNEAFSSGTGIFEYPSPIPEDKAAAPDEQEKEEDQEKTDKKEKAKMDQEKREMLAKQADKRELESIQKKVKSYIKEKKLSEQLEATMTDEGLLVSIRDNVLFESGSDQVRRQDLKIAEEISDLLVMSPPRNIVISGHTDNVPIKNAQFGSNWELSVMRSINFMKLLLENDKLDPSWFSAKGFGEFNPITSNKTAEGKAKNRRVEILILPRN